MGPKRASIFLCAVAACRPAKALHSVSEADLLVPAAFRNPLPLYTPRQLAKRFLSNQHTTGTRPTKALPTARAHLAHLVLLALSTQPTAAAGLPRLLAWLLHPDQTVVLRPTSVSVTTHTCAHVSQIHATYSCPRPSSAPVSWGGKKRGGGRTRSRHVEGARAGMVCVDYKKGRKSGTSS